ncbi:MAG: type I 3-dehydroquinate dehydratase [Holophagaceae bacterium]
MRLPFLITTLSHPAWRDALACARALPAEALPELRLDLLRNSDPASLVRDLGGRCLVTARRASELGRWPDEDEAGRLAALHAAVEAGAAWVDFEWELPVPAWLAASRGQVGLLRSVHVAPGIFDGLARLQHPPEGDAFKWVGHASSLRDLAHARLFCEAARARGLQASGFLMGPKGVASRCLQKAWGGAFTYAAPDDGPPAAPGQLTLSTMRAWGVHRAGPMTKVFAVAGEPALHSRSPAYHNHRFTEAGLDALYLPLEASDPDEVLFAAGVLHLQGLSLTAPLKESLPPRLGLKGPLNTLWREGDAWHGANTDAEALDVATRGLPPGPVLVLGSGGVAATSVEVGKGQRRRVRPSSRRAPMTAAEVKALAPVGVIQATTLGMGAGDPCPFPELLEAARPTLAWAVEWIYKERTAFAAWARGAGLRLVEGAALFEAQAEGQSRRFLRAAAEG